MDKKTLTQIRKELENCIGKRVQLKANKGRKKTSIREGIIENAYPSIFTVRLENEYKSTRSVSYNYTDVLTRTVEVKVMSTDMDRIAL